MEPRSVERLMKPINQVIDAKGDPESTTVAWPVDLMATGPRPTDATGCSCDQILDATRWCLPLRRHADSLVDLYFSRVHRMYPILHRGTFMKQYERLWQSTSSATVNPSLECSGLCKQKSRGKTFPAMVHAVFALASLFQSGPPEQNTVQAETFFRLAQAIDLLEIMDDEVGIQLIQLGLLMGFYLQSTERFSKCWNITGLTVRMAQNMGLQLGLGEARKKGLFASCATQLECEMRIRVWYGCVLLDRYGCPLRLTAITSFTTVIFEVNIRT